ncbi:oxidoreductase, fad-binding [Trichoderma arundinaceum]|uniref:Oxidoreductase, fad-binding n=1 Tax=Trichoderma arundinaceum TaxID=490622 RepID=A0A395P1D8_TRIAR|nr:oxidoreductase, fad-binding [Trichoderma arundinaceum]
MTQVPYVQALVTTLGHEKVLHPGSDGYTSYHSSYFSQQQAQLRPAAVISPTRVEDVAQAVRHLASAEDQDGKPARFAVRSGGHAVDAGAANIDGGVTIDLSRLNAIEVSEDRKIVSIGPGANWGQVYEKLDGLGLSVAGGRASPVGVGGLTTGGGMSYFSPRYGWTCDTVSNFQVVLADGSVVNANEKENEDLHIALRGGTNNFGIVTRFDFNAFEQGQLWGGALFHSLETIDENLKAFVDFASAEDYDEYASLITSFGFAAGRGAGIVNNVEYTKPVEKPPVFEPFLKIPSVMSTMRVASMADISKEQGAFSPYGMRQFVLQTTHTANLDVLKTVFSHWKESLTVIEDVANIIWSISLEPLPPIYYKRAATANSLGLADRTKPLVITLLTAMWTDEADDIKVEKAARKIFVEIEAKAKELGEYDPFVYANYAAPWQDPITSYGKESVERLKKVRQRVDPKGVFTHRVAGAFKLPA